MNTLIRFFEYGIFFYSSVVLMSYLFLAIISAYEVLRYRKERDITDYQNLLATPLMPSIAIIAPAYNESPTIIDNIRSLLSLHYTNLTVIVVNDGSKDDTFDKAVATYDLELVDFYYDEKIAAQPVRGIYKSRNSGFSKLIFVDKKNGGKADAINVGINVSNADYFACIDVDCIIEPDAFLKMAKLIMQAENERIIAVGGIVWLTNDSYIRKGRLLEVRTPETFVPRIQVIEYFRVFLLGRTAWAKVNGMLLISGAFGLFDREIAVAAGGYYHKTVGEDMELVMRMHRYMRERQLPYKIGYLPEPLCWTEAPSDFNILGRQRHRWTRGTIECLLLHKKMFFNPKYGILGMVSYPYWLFAEWLSPFVEAGGLLFFIIMVVLGRANWAYFWALLFFVYAFVVFLSLFAILVQEISYHRYRKHRDLTQLILTAIVEPIVYHPRVIYWALKGNWDFFHKKNMGWGEMKRKGF